MKLLELYSLATGLRIGQQYLVESFYPLSYDRYITIQAGSGMAAKNYPHYDDVLSLMTPALNCAGIKILQLGGKEDRALPGCIHLQGQTNLHQSNYLLHRSLCHVGNDSWMSHRGGEMEVPLVICFGPTTPENHGPYRYDPHSVFIESHRFGRRPTFASQESPSTIAVIPPEQIANAALGLLGLPKVNRQSLYIGEAYHQTAVELAPDSVLPPSVNVGGALVIRMDHATPGDPEAENRLAANLQLRRCLVVTDRELNLNLLIQMKPNLGGLRVEVDGVSAAWIKAVKRLGIQTAFFSSERDPDKLARRRLDLYDACLFDHYLAPTREDFLKGASTYLNRTVDSTVITPRLQFTTHKLLLAGGKVYLSEAHWRAGQPTPGPEVTTGNVIDNDTFWEEQAHFYVHDTIPTPTTTTS